MLDARYRAKYGLRFSEFAERWRKQAGACWICKRTDRDLVVDHDHDTGEVRALLCAQCNSAIGLLGDNPSTIMRAAAYLRRMDYNHHQRLERLSKFIANHPQT